MKWYTCAPLHFKGQEAFFRRDTGLICTELNRIGIESRAVLLAPQIDGESPCVIRATQAELESSQWWANHRLDGLLILTWGHPRYRPVVEAAMRAGIKVVQYTDTPGWGSFFGDWKTSLLTPFSFDWDRPYWEKLMRCIIKIPIKLSIHFIKRDLPKARMITSSHLFLSASHQGERLYRNLVRRLISKEAAIGVHFVPLPVASDFVFEPGMTKMREVIAIGRWDDRQKRAPLMMKTIERFLGEDTKATSRIFGKTTTEIVRWHTCLAESIRRRVTLEGLIPNADLVSALQRARIILVCSAYESFHIASAEAICTGCSVVAPRSTYLEPVIWQTTRNSGTVAKKPTPESLCSALHAEMKLWDNGNRDPIAISKAWTSELHPQHIARKILRLSKNTR